MSDPVRALMLVRVVKDWVTRSETVLKQQVLELMEPTDRRVVTVDIDGAHTELGFVTRTKVTPGKRTAVVVDQKAFTAWAVDVHPEWCQVIVEPAWAGTVLDQTAAGTEWVTADGELVVCPPGVELRDTAPSGGHLMVKPTTDPDVLTTVMGAVFRAPAELEVR